MQNLAKLSTILKSVREVRIQYWEYCILKTLTLFTCEPLPGSLVDGDPFCLFGDKISPDRRRAKVLAAASSFSMRKHSRFQNSV